MESSAKYFVPHLFAAFKRQHPEVNLQLTVVNRALAFGLPEIPAMFVGVVSAVGGSIIRDVMLNIPIAVMHVGSLYAVAAGVGCGLLVVLNALGVQITIAAIICTLTTTVIRILAAKFGWSLPQQRALGSWPRWRRPVIVLRRRKHD